MWRVLSTLTLTNDGGLLAPQLLLLCVVALQQCLAMPLGSQCMDESFCTSSLQDYYSQLVNLPHRINERSVAAWSYMYVGPQTHSHDVTTDIYITQQTP